MMPRDYFFGLYRIKAYDYWWGYSLAQIELMAVDVPMVVYGKKKKFSKPSREALEDATRQWNEKYGNERGTKVDVSRLLADRVSINV